MKGKRLTLFDDYLNNSLSPEERGILEKRLKEEAELREQFLSYQIATDAIEQEVQSHTRKTLKQALAQDKARRKRSTQKRILAGAMAAAAAIALFVFLPMLDATPGEKVFHQYYSAAPDQVSRDLQGQGFLAPEEEMSLLREAMLAYRQQNYHLAEQQLDLFLNASQNSYLTDFARYYKAHTLLATQQYQAAVPLFEILLPKEDFPLHTEAKWYLALTYLAGGEEEKAWELLSALRSSPEYGERASRILEED